MPNWHRFFETPSLNFYIPKAIYALYSQLNVSARIISNRMYNNRNTSINQADIHRSSGRDKRLICTRSRDFIPDEGITLRSGEKNRFAKTFSDAARWIWCCTPKEKIYIVPSSEGGRSTRGWKITTEREEERKKRAKTDWPMPRRIYPRFFFSLCPSLSREALRRSGGSGAHVFSEGKLDN